MKKIHITAIAASVAIVTTILLIPIAVATRLDYKRLARPLIVKHLLYRFTTMAQDRWIDRLEKCESGGNHLAINPNDSDGTPSYGAFQFKPDTFYYFSDLYGFPHEADYMFYGRQRALVEQMVIHESSVNFHQQFPACTRRLGLPPVI